MMFVLSGNEHFRTARMNTPAFRELGEKGKARWINVELKLVADVGLIGVPNAGSNLLTYVQHVCMNIYDMSLLSYNC